MVDGNGQVEAAPSGGGSPKLDSKQANALTSKLISASIGDIVVVMSKSPAHRHMGLGDIEWMVLPAVLTGQFYVAEVQHKETGARAPVAVVTWASVSDEIDQTLHADPKTRIRLAWHEWKSGEHLWIVDAAGEQRTLLEILQILADGPLRDKAVNLAVRDSGGRLRVDKLSHVLRAASEQASGTL